MKAQVALAGLLLLSAVVLIANPVFAHSGGLDAYGCHHDRKNGGYHCHQGPLAGNSYVSQPEMLGALEALNQEESNEANQQNDHPEWLLPPDPSEKAPDRKVPELYKIVRASL